MTITSFEAHRFRNFQHLQITPSPKLNIIYGNNASGKTSLIEAIYYLGSARSFRTALTHHLIQTDTDNFICFAEIEDQHGQTKQLHHLGVQRYRDQQKIKHNGEVLQRSSELARLLPLQIINNDIHNLIDGGPKIRRQFLDWGLFHHQADFAALMKTFRQTLKQRNAALKQNWSQQQVKHWDTILIDTANKINHYRKNYLKNIQQQFEQLLEDSFNLPTFQMRFRQGWEKDADYSTALKNNWEIDRQRGNTSVGPHKADIYMSTEKRALKEIVSRGQQKIIASLLLLAQIEYFNANCDQSLILLIDDLPAELDKHFSNLFLRKILKTNTQLFITATDYKLLPLPELLPQTKMFHVEQGNVKEDEIEPTTR